MNDYNRLKSELNRVENFFCENNIANLSGKSNTEYIYDFELNLKSFVLIDNAIVIKDKFQFRIIIPFNYPTSLPKIITWDYSNIPFHPNFKVHSSLLRSSKYAEWIDYKEHFSRSIPALLKRLILSLQFDDDYIKHKSKKIGNHDAENWLLRAYHTNNNRFPTDEFFRKNTVVNVHNTISNIKFQIDEKIIQPSKKKFEINRIISSYEPIERKLRDIKIDESLSSIITTAYNNNFLLFITSAAKELLWKHIQWGNKSAHTNKVEQGGLLLGNVYIDSDKNIQYGLVEKIVPGASAKGNAVHLEMDHSTWSEMIDQVDKILEGQNENQLHIIGWYHTHPKSLDVFMSPTDKDTQKKLFNRKWQYAIVSNPHRQIWKAFYGRESTECLGMFIKSSNFYSSAYSDSKEQETEDYSEERPKQSINKSIYLIPLLLVIISIFIGFYLFGHKNEVIERIDLLILNKKTIQSQITNPVNSELKEDSDAINKITTINPKKYTLLLGKGKTIYTMENTPRFHFPLEDSLEVIVFEKQDSILKFEIELYAHKKVVNQLNDSTIKINEDSNLRVQPKIQPDVIFGELLEEETFTLLSREKSWYKLILRGIIRISSENDTYDNFK